MTQLSNSIQQGVPLLGIQGIPFSCQLALNLFMCNFGHFSCNLTTGTPKPVCSESCFYLCQNRRVQYNFIKQTAEVWGFPVVDDCNNTLRNLELWYNIKLSSDDFKDDCLDFGLDSKYHIL